MNLSRDLLVMRTCENRNYILEKDLYLFWDKGRSGNWIAGSDRKNAAPEMEGTKRFLPFNNELAI